MSHTGKEIQNILPRKILNKSCLANVIFEQFLQLKKRCAFGQDMIALVLDCILACWCNTKVFHGMHISYFLLYLVFCIVDAIYGRIARCGVAFWEINQTLCAFQRQPSAKSAKAGIDHCTDHDDGDADHDS